MVREYGEVRTASGNEAKELAMDGIDRHHEAKQDTHEETRRGRWVLIGFLVVAAFFLWTEHRAHLLGALPWLLVLACPLMHLFHHGHGHHGGHGHTSDAGRSRSGKGEGDAP